MPGSPGSSGSLHESRGPLRRLVPGGTSRRPRSRALWAAGTGVAATALLLPLLSSGPYANAEQRGTSRLQQQFADAAGQYRVPESVLLAVSYLQSRWDTHDGAPSVSGGYGPMHLTDARAALARSSSPARTPHGTEDPRGDTARPSLEPRAAAHGERTKQRESGDLPARLRTAERAAELTGLPRERLRESTAANLRGGAALLAAAQKKQGRPLSSDPADWYGAVASFPAASDRVAGRAFADDVFDVMRSGEQRTTDSGQRVRLPAEPGLRPDRTQADETTASRRSSAEKTSKARKPECPRSVSCEWLPAPYEEYTDDDGNATYGNHDKARRPGSASIDYIVVHDTEGSWDTVMDLIQDPTYVSWNYSLRSSDGHIAQHVAAKDAAWHAGNWYVNAKSVGLEHEGFLTDPDAWFTEAMYRSSARLVRYLAGKYDIPLDRQHIIGHDNVPGVTTANIRGMHTDPGPYFDWRHYFSLLGKPFSRSGKSGGKLLTIRPDYDRNRPQYTGCDDAGKACEAHGSGAVRLHTAPDADSALVKDEGLHPDGGKSTTGVNDTGARASTGQQYALADRKGDWTAIWYLGQKAWFHNPAKQPTAVPSRGDVVVPKSGKDEVPVYGRAYPEKDAYPKGVPAQELSPLPYKFKAGQAYAAGLKTRGEYLYAKEFDPKAEKFKVVRGDLTYYQIQLGHRVAFVKADDVKVVRR